MDLSLLMWISQGTSSGSTRRISRTPTTWYPVDGDTHSTNDTVLLASNSRSRQSEDHRKTQIMKSSKALNCVRWPLPRSRVTEKAQLHSSSQVISTSHTRRRSRNLKVNRSNLSPQRQPLRSRRKLGKNPCALGYLASSSIRKVDLTLRAKQERSRSLKMEFLQATAKRKYQDPLRRGSDSHRGYEDGEMHP